MTYSTHPLRHLTIGLAALCLAGLIAAGCGKGKSPSTPSDDGPAQTKSDIDSVLEPQLTALSVLEQAFASQRSDFQVLVKGTVTRFLSDDVSGSEHQRFIVQMSNGQTLLVAHNIDLGQRLPTTALNHLVYLYGEYAYNSEGGVIHWTHIDPAKTHEDGWIQFDGTKYQ
jgi:hypothetical protein